MRASAKMLPMTFTQFGIRCRSIVFLPRDVDSNFQGQTFHLAIWQVSVRKCKHYYCRQIGSRVFAIKWRHCNCCTLWRWPSFSGWRHFKFEYLKNNVASETFSGMTFIEVYICHRLGQLPLVYSVTFISKVNRFLVTQLAIKMRRQLIPAAHLPRFARLPSRSCSCYIFYRMTPMRKFYFVTLT